MMMKLLLFALLFPMLLLAQEKPRNWNVKLDAIQLLDPFGFPVVQLSVERKLDDRFSILAEGGIQLYEAPSNWESTPDTLIYNSRGFKANIEFRCYIFKLINPDRYSHRGAGGFFAGIQPFYKQNRYTAGIAYRNENTPTDPITFAPMYEKDYFGVKNQSYGANVTLGYQKRLLERFIFEPSLAIGHRYRKITNIDRVYNPEIYKSDNNHDIFGFEDRLLHESSGNTTSFSLHLRLGYTF